ncbi:MAG: hypothetical protein JOY99_06525 [Sphingomonadaceae bacterium]|nr:hypothetical protein [Sphingomonadaceae bacterium]
MILRTSTRLSLAALAIGLAAPAFAQAAPDGDVGAPYSVPSDTGSPMMPPPPSAGGSGAPAGRSGIQIHPYLEVDQVLDAPISGGGDVLTYTDLSAGIDVAVSERNIQAQLDYRYDHNFAWGHHFGDEDTHNGLASVDWAAIPGLVSVDGAAIVTRARDSLDFASPDFLTRDHANTQLLYGAYVGPTISHQFGDLNATAAYHFGYTHADNGEGTLVLGPGQPVFDDFSNEYNHTINASVGERPGALPFGWTLSGYWERDQQDFLHARFEDKYVRGDITLPVSYTVALVGGVGYEKLEQNERQLLVDGSGNAILTGSGRLQSDPNAPRLLVYEQDGLIWDAGLSWRPNARTRFEIRGGRRYGEWVAYGSLDYQMSRTAHLQGGLFDDVQTFGHGVSTAIAGLPTSFNAAYSPLVGNLNGCVLGVGGGQGACVGTALTSINGNLFRVQGGYLLLSGEEGRWSYGLGGDYVRRHYLTPTDAVGATFLFAGVTEQEATVQANVGRQLSPISGVDGAIYGTWYKSDLAVVDEPSTYTAGATATYHRNFTPHLLGQVSGAIYGYDSSRIDTTVAASALVGARYTF